MYGVKKVKKKDKKTNNFSGNVINKVGSLNYMTAIKNSERPVTPESSKLRINKMRQNEISKHYTRK